MKSVSSRVAAVRQEPRTQRPLRAQQPLRAVSPAPAALTEWAWPGLTRAELRELVIEQIG